MDMPDPRILKGQFFRQPVPVLCIPAAVVGRIHDPFSALGSSLLGSRRPRSFHKGFEKLANRTISPIPSPWGLAVFVQLHLLAVIREPSSSGCSNLRIFSMGAKTTWTPAFTTFQQVQEPPELFLEIYIPLSVTKLLNAVLLVLVTQLGNAEHLRPVRCKSMTNVWQ